jgi:hypothetical protein
MRRPLLALSLLVLSSGTTLAQVTTPSAVQGSSAATSPDLSGAWDFTVDLGASVTRGAMRITREANGLGGTLTAAGPNALPIRSLTLEGAVVQLTVDTPEGPVVFDGTLDTDRAAMRGIVTYHGGKRYPLNAWRERSAAQAADEAAARVPLEAYLRGHATGDSTAFRRAFWKDAKLWSVRDGQLASRTADEYIGAASGRPAADEAQRTRRIVSVHITGNAAIAVIELDYPATHFIDYMTLLRVGDEWRIINKSFFAAPRARP